MIELFKVQDFQKKWGIFKKRKMAYYSLIGIVIAAFFTFTAEFWANSKPVVLNYNGQWFFPIFKTYDTDKFDLHDVVTVDYRTIDKSKIKSVIWPVIKWDPFESNTKIDIYPGKPTSDNLMGTDDRGRDVLSRLLYGLRYGLIFSILVWIITFILGALIGGVQGYVGGRLDLIGQRVTEILSTVPQFFLLIILIAVFQPSMMLLVFIMSLFGWIGISYYMRAEFLKHRNKEYVEAARAMGCSNFTIFFKHILPNSLGPIITFSPFVIASGIIALASLDYLGFGLTPPTPSWGEMLNQARSNFSTAWWLAFFPGMALFLILTMLNLIGEGVRDVFDPHRK